MRLLKEKDIKYKETNNPPFLYANNMITINDIDVTILIFNKNRIRIATTKGIIYYDDLLEKIKKFDKNEN